MASAPLAVSNAITLAAEYFLVGVGHYLYYLLNDFIFCFGFTGHKCDAGEFQDWMCLGVIFLHILSQNDWILMDEARQKPLRAKFSPSLSFPSFPPLPYSLQYPSTPFPFPSSPLFLLRSRSR